MVDTGATTGGCEVRSLFGCLLCRVCPSPVCRLCPLQPPLDRKLHDVL
jgi:hypothetical protein